MTEAERAVAALEYIAQDLLALMLRANESGFSAKEVLDAVEFVLANSRSALIEEQKDRIAQAISSPQSRSLLADLLH